MVLFNCAPSLRLGIAMLGYKSRGSPRPLENHPSTSPEASKVKNRAGVVRLENIGKAIY
jgi:hypothetical protein